MAASVVSQTQQVGQTVVDTGVSIFQQLYNNPFVHGVLSLLFAVGLSLLLIFFSRIISVFVRNKVAKNFVVKKGAQTEKMGILIGDFVFYVMAFFSIYVAFTIADIDIKLLMSGITIGVGFAFRQTLSNMISGIMIFSTDEYKLGNIVQLKMEGDVFGIIEEINMKNVIIRTFDMRRVVMPNSRFLKKAIKTYSAEEFLRLQVSVVVDINMDMPLVLQETLRVVNDLPFILNKQYTQVLLDSFDDKKAKVNIQLFFNPNSGLSAEYIKSLVQVQLLELYKKILKASKKAEKAVSESAAHAAVVSSSSPQIEVHAAVVPASTVSA